MLDTPKSQQLIPVASEDDDIDMYAYMKEEGSVIVQIVGPGRGGYHYEIEEYGLGGQANWISEGVGIEFWMDWLFDGEELEPGWYAIEDVCVSFSRGDGWTTDDNEDWETGLIRPATEEEIETLSVIKQEESQAGLQA